MKAVDFSNWTAVPSQAQLACLRALGVTRAIIGTRGNVKFGVQASACRQGGLEVEAYAFLYANEPGDAQARRMADAMRPLNVRKGWLDVERDPARLIQEPPHVWRACIWSARRQLEALGYAGASRPGIYSSESGWTLTGNTREHADLDFWEARWRYPSGDPRNLLEPPLPFRPIGGWTKRAVVQYAGDVTVCSLNVDMNEIEAETPTPPPGGQEDEMWHRHNELAQNDYWANARHTFGAGELATIQLGVDLPRVMALRPSAIDLDLYTDGAPGALLEVRDGNGNFAGSCDAKRRNAVVRVVPVNGTIQLVGVGAPVTVTMGVVGYVE